MGLGRDPHHAALGGAEALTSACRRRRDEGSLGAQAVRPGDESYRRILPTHTCRHTHECTHMCTHERTHTCTHERAHMHAHPDPSSKATLWVKAQHEGALPPPCIVRKDPRVFLSQILSPLPLTL